MRDVTLVLMKENKVVAKMIQINYIQATSKKNSEITHEEEHYYGDANGSYSFAIEPASIKREKNAFTCIKYLTKTQKLGHLIQLLFSTMMREMF